MESCAFFVNSCHRITSPSCSQPQIRHGSLAFAATERRSTDHDAIWRWKTAAESLENAISSSRTRLRSDERRENRRNHLNSHGRKSPCVNGANFLSQKRRLVLLLVTTKRWLAGLSHFPNAVDAFKQLIINSRRIRLFIFGNHFGKVVFYWPTWYSLTATNPPCLFDLTYLTAIDVLA